MPYIHQGYGFPVGGVAATEVPDGVVSPGVLATTSIAASAHNVAKLESHGGRRVLVHRKGATRAFPAGSDEIPLGHREVGQPLFIPGSMGTSSFVLAGKAGSMERSFGTT